MGLGGRRLGFIWRWGRGGGCGNVGGLELQDLVIHGLYGYRPYYLFARLIISR